MMKRWGCGPSLALAAILCAGFAAAAGAVSKSSLLKPAPGSVAVKVHSGKKARVYYSASRVNPLEYKVRGPVMLRVYSRCTFAAPTLAKPTNYHLVVDVDGRPLRTAAVTSGVSKSARGDDGTPLGNLKKSIFRIPVGEHTVRITPGEATTVLLRIVSGSGKNGKVRMVSFQPETYAKAVRLHEKDAEMTVYRFSPSQPIGLSIQGPLRLRVLTRLDFGTTNGVTQSYVVKATLDGSPFKSFTLKSTASHTATYPDMTEITPGSARTVLILVPRGRHRITIALDGTTAEGATARIEIPQRPARKGAR